MFFIRKGIEATTITCNITQGYHDLTIKSKIHISTNEGQSQNRLLKSQYFCSNDIDRTFYLRNKVSSSSELIKKKTSIHG